MPPSVCPPPPPAPWRSYPYQLVSGDPQLVFPAAEGHPDVASDAYYASGVLRGETSGRRYAFLTIFAKNRDILDLLSADLHVLALFDLDAGTYDTGSRFDLPPGREFNLDRINVTRGRLEVSYTSNRRVSRMRARTDAEPPVSFRLRLRPQRRSPIGNGDGAQPVCRRAEAAAGHRRLRSRRPHNLLRPAEHLLLFPGPGVYRNAALGRDGGSRFRADRLARSSVVPGVRRPFRGRARRPLRTSMGADFPR